MIDLEKIIPKNRIKYNESMANHTSFKTGGMAECYVIVQDEKEVIDVLSSVKEKNIPLFIIGNGSNLLVKDQGIKGIVLKIDLQGIDIEDGLDDEIIVTVKAGTKMMALAQILKQKGISGFEELSGIPGTIGGAIRMNAGAYGKEMKDIVIDTVCVDKDGKKYVFSNANQKFEYRNSIFKNGNFVVIETKLRLKKGNVEEIEEKMKEYMNSRKEKQPVEYPSAGSTFKRGNGFITAKLIDDAGLKGYSIGGAQISEKHAGFIINKGDATSEDILNLIEYTKKVVLEKFDVKIEEEVEIIGD